MENGTILPIASRTGLLSCGNVQIMLKRIKRRIYFGVARYFRFFAKIQLMVWQPSIMVITGSSGKTTLLHLMESQIKEGAKYSHHANSAYGIPFDILGLKRTTLARSEWIYLFLSAPFRAFKKPPREQWYVVEADCDRPGEGKFLAALLEPDITIWMSSSKTHSVNFEKLVGDEKFPSVEKAIAYEYGHFLEHTRRLAIINGDNPGIAEQRGRTTAPLIPITKAECFEDWRLESYGTEFKIAGTRYHLDALLPEEVSYSIAAGIEALKFLNIPCDASFKDFILPPGRSSVFAGIKRTLLIDSSYNATFDGMSAILNMFDRYAAKIKWAVVGDMPDQGSTEAEEHEKLADVIARCRLNTIVLAGPKISKYTYPKLKNLFGDDARIEAFASVKDALDHIKTSLDDGAAVLCKGVRMESVVEHLLANQEDAKKLCRREQFWQLKRKDWGL